MTEREKMVSGQLYLASDPELVQARQRAHQLTQRLNESADQDPPEQRAALMEQLFGRTGKAPWIEPNFRCDYGFNIHVGDFFYANFDCVFLDGCSITIGNHVMLGPRVGLFTACHPLDPDVRASGLEYSKPIVIGDHVWIGGGAIVNPGVTIGSRVVIGSGSVVTKDIPDNAIAVGNPCKVIRLLTEEDTVYWHRLAQEYAAL